MSSVISLVFELLESIEKTSNWLQRQKSSLKMMKSEDDIDPLTLHNATTQTSDTKTKLTKLNACLRSLKYNPFKAKTFLELHNEYIQHMKKQEVKEYRRVLDRMIAVVVHNTELNGNGLIFPYSVTVEDDGLFIEASRSDPERDDFSECVKFEDIEKWELTTPADAEYKRSFNPNISDEFYEFN